MTTMSWRITGSAGGSDDRAGELPEHGERGLVLMAAGAVDVAGLQRGRSRAGLELEVGHPLEGLDVHTTRHGLLVRAPEPGWRVNVAACKGLPLTFEYAGSVSVRGWRGPLRAKWTDRRDCRLDWTRAGRRLVVEGVAASRRRLRVAGVETLKIEPATTQRGVQFKVEGAAREIDRLRFTLTRDELVIGDAEPVDVRVKLQVPRAWDVEIVDVHSVKVGDIHARLSVHNTRGGKWVVGAVEKVSGYVDGSGLKIASVSEQLRLLGRAAEIVVGRGSQTSLVRAVLQGGSLRFPGRTKWLEMLAVGGAGVTVGTVQESAVVRANDGTQARFGGPATTRVALFADGGNAVIEHTTTRQPRPAYDRLRTRGGGRIAAPWMDGRLPIEYAALGRPASPHTLDPEAWSIDCPLHDQGAMLPGCDGVPVAVRWPSGVFADCVKPWR